MMDDPRDRFIAQVAGGRSFIDVGGLFGILKERITAAHRAGATKLALLDLEGQDCPWWGEMRKRLDAHNVGSCEFISADILRADLQTHDVVHSSGVLYHMPCPISFIQKLRKITSQYCILTSMTISRRIIGTRSELHFPDSSVLFVPSLQDHEKEIVIEWFLSKGIEDVADPVESVGQINYYRNWFIPTVPAFKSMAAIGGFEIVDEAAIEDYAYTLMLRPSEHAAMG